MTSVTSWERPVKSNLPPNWGECKDDKGAVYYYNYVNGESSWDRPGEATSQRSARPVSDSTIQAMLKEKERLKEVQMEKKREMEERKRLKEEERRRQKEEEEKLKKAKEEERVRQRQVFDMKHKELIAPFFKKREQKRLEDEEKRRTKEEQRRKEEEQRRIEEEEKARQRYDMGAL